MQTAQRILLVVAFIFLVMGSCFVVQHDRTKKYMEQWEQSRSKLFLQRISRQKEFSLKDYIGFAHEVRYLDNDIEIFVEIYQKEWDLEKNEYYFLLPWEEVKVLLEQNNRIELEDGNIIRLVLQQRNKKYEYSVIVTGRE